MRGELCLRAVESHPRVRVQRHGRTKNEPVHAPSLLRQRCRLANANSAARRNRPALSASPAACARWAITAQAR